MKTNFTSSVALLITSLLLVCTHTESHAQSTNKEIQLVLPHIQACSKTISLRSEALTNAQEKATCLQLSEVEKKFHQIFQTKGKPVEHDFNTSLRANIYQSSDSYTKNASKHFNMPTNNGGMYLEGLPKNQGNHAEFVAYQNKDGGVKNLSHEYVHYLDGRFNLYGDFCANLHDSHAPPENCDQPTPLAPYLVWWTEGVAEYISRGNNNSYAINIGKAKTYQLSQLFNTAYEINNGNDRVYAWGYLATRFMMEKHRDKIEQMLKLTRKGDFPRYQALVQSWGTSMDSDFQHWLESLVSP